MTPTDIEALLLAVGQKITAPSRLVLVGGGALALPMDQLLTPISIEISR